MLWLNNYSIMFKYFISDIDGCLNDGRIYWDALGQKPFKAFGNYDHDGVKLLRDHIKLIFISADQHGWDILQSRVADHMKCELHYVPEADRYNFVAQYGFDEVAYMEMVYLTPRLFAQPNWESHQHRQELKPDRQQIILHPATAVKEHTWMLAYIL